MRRKVGDPMKLTALLAPFLLLAACTTIKVSEDTWAFTPGKGCIYVSGDTIIAESDGISINLSSAIQALTSAAGSVLGGGRDNTDGERRLESGEGCRGVLDTVFESGSDASAGFDDEPAPMRVIIVGDEGGE